MILENVVFRLLILEAARNTKDMKKGERRHERAAARGARMFALVGTSSWARKQALSPVTRVPCCCALLRAAASPFAAALLVGDGLSSVQKARSMLCLCCHVASVTRCNGGSLSYAFSLLPFDRRLAVGDAALPRLLDATVELAFVVRVVRSRPRELSQRTNVACYSARVLVCG